MASPSSSWPSSSLAGPASPSAALASAAAGWAAAEVTAAAAAAAGSVGKSSGANGRGCSPDFSTSWSHADRAGPRSLAALSAASQSAIGPAFSRAAAPAVVQWSWFAARSMLMKSGRMSCARKCSSCKRCKYHSAIGYLVASAGGRRRGAGESGGRREASKHRQLHVRQIDGIIWT